MQTQGKDATARRMQDELTLALCELERLRAVLAAARASVGNPAWSGVCDQDVMLERAIKDYDAAVRGDQIASHNR